MEAVIERTFYQVAPHKCGSWYCSRCGVRKGLDLQGRILKVVESWSSVMMITLTLDPKLFEGPDAAWDYSRKLIGRLIRDLHRMGYLPDPAYVAFWEPHESGWPHWHILVQSKFIPYHVLQRVWHRYGPTGKLGGVNLRKQKRFETNESAARYATKYVVKNPKDGWPEWVLDCGKRMPRYYVSHGFFASLAESQGNLDFESPFEDGFSCLDAEGALERPKVVDLGRPLREKLDKCGAWCELNAVTEFFRWDKSWIHREKIGWIDASKVRLRMLAGLDPDEKVSWWFEPDDGLDWLLEMAGHY